MKQIWKKTFKGYFYEVKISDLPPNLDPNDIIEIKKDEPAFINGEYQEPMVHLLIWRKIK